MKITLLRTTSCGCVPVGAGSWGGEECKQRPDHSRPAVLWERRWTNHRRFPWRLTTDQIISDTHTHTQYCLLSTDWRHLISFCHTMLCINARDLCLFLMSRSYILSKWIKISSTFFHHRVATLF